MQEETLEKYNKGKEMFLTGSTLKDVAKELKISSTRFGEWLRGQGYTTKYKCEDIYKQGMEMYVSGQEKSTEKIARQLKISRKRFAQWMREQGVTITNSSKIYTCNEDYFKVINDEHKAYWLGFLYADGCIVERKRGDKVKSRVLEVGLQILDKPHLEKFNKDLDSNYLIKDRNNKLGDKTYESCRLIINSTKMCNDLIKLGCTPRKSLTLTFPTEEQVPKHLQKHFVRGYVDGDGSVMWNPRHSCGRLSLLGTKEFLQECRKQMEWRENALTCDGGNGQAYNIEYSGAYVTEYLKQLYENSTIYLDRKYEKYKEIIAVLSQKSQETQDD
jgi:phage antirepressor YoqD-like protein